MFFYNLKSAFRYFFKQKEFVVINFLGLVTAFAVSSLIMLYVFNELRQNSEYKNARQIYRLLVNQEAVKTTYAVTTLDMGLLIKENIPEVERATRITHLKPMVLIDDKEISFNSMFVDPDFIEMFDIRGENIIDASFLSEPNSILLTEETAKKIFGSEYPVGKDLRLKFPHGVFFFKVKGVINNFSKFSVFDGDFIINFDFYHKNLCDAFLESYPIFTTFLMVPSRTDPSFIAKKINKANVEDWTGVSFNKYELQRFNRMYLHSDYLTNNIYPVGNARILYGLFFLVLLIVITACLNFGILSTACALNRSKEIGVRKINGATLKQVKKQIMLESYLLAILALPISLLIAKLLLPWFNILFNRELKFSFMENIPVAVILLILVFLSATLSGFFTSASTVKMTPISLLKKENTKLKTGVNLNKMLLTSQMVIVIWFLAIAILVTKQIHFSQKKGLGYNPENVITINVRAPKGWDNGSDAFNRKIQNPDKLENFKRILKETPFITNVATFYEPPPYADQIGSGSIKLVGMDDRKTIASIGGSAEYPELFEYHLKSGQFFSDNYSGENKYEYILNEAAVKYLGVKEPVGKQVDLGNGKFGKIIGVVEDFNFQSMRKKIVPLKLNKFIDYSSKFSFVLRYKSGMSEEALKAFKSNFNAYYSGYSSETVFHENQIEALYKKEMTEARVLTLGIILAVFISVMGIFGISLFSIRQRVKEIGIRKINGAETQSILSMINLNIARWVGLAFVIATPLAWLSMNKWLENFAYKTSLSWWIFALAGVLALGIALLTVSWQSWRAATRNPVEALRYE